VHAKASKQSSKIISCEGQGATHPASCAINQSKVLRKSHTGKEKPHPSTSERGGHRPFEWGRRVCGGLSSALGVVRCGRSAGCVLCVLWAISAAVWGGSTLWG